MWSKWYQLGETQRMALVRKHGSAANAAYILFGDNR